MTKSQSIEEPTFYYSIEFSPETFPVTEEFADCPEIVMTSKTYTQVPELLADVNQNISAMLEMLAVSGVSEVAVVKILASEDNNDILSEGERCLFCVINKDDLVNVETAPTAEMVENALICVTVY